VESIGIEKILTAPRDPWQNPFVERMIGRYGEIASTVLSCSANSTFGLFSRNI